MTLRFVTIFPDGAAVHLGKDVGQVPYILARDYAFASTLVIESNEPLQVGPLAPHLSVQSLAPRCRVKGISLAALLFVARKAKQIDVLNLYHFCLQTKLLALLYRFRHPAGFLYVKLDLNIQDERAAMERVPAAGWLSGLGRTWLHRRFFKAVNLFSAESHAAVAVFSEHFPLAAHKMVRVTNGLDLRSVAETTGEKENLMISVGRIGAFEKNHELLLDAVRLARLGDWKLALVGPVTAAFEDYFKRFIDENPALRDRISLTGAVSDRAALLRWYDRAKVFVLTSRNEGYPLVFGEALSFGNFLISTDVSCVREITLRERYGLVVDNDPRALADAMERFTIGGAYTATLSEEIIRHGRSLHDWTTNLGVVNTHIANHFHV